MNPTYAAIVIVIAHFVIDWMAQTRYEATNKSKNFLVLLQHLRTNFLGFALVCLIFFPEMNFDRCCKALLLNTFTHGVIDWNIWRLYAYFHRNESPEFMEKNLYAKDYWFYFTIASDQILHLVIALYLFMP